MAAAGSPAISRSEPLSSGEAVGGFYIDLRKIRKIQKAQEAKARNLTKTERRELDDAIAASIERDQQRRAERKGKMPWSKKKPEADSGETPDES